MREHRKLAVSVDARTQNHDFPKASILSRILYVTSPASIEDS